MSNIGRKVALAAVAFATVGSTAFGGVALAGGHEDIQDAVGGNAAGGTAQGGCLVPVNVGIPIINTNPSQSINCSTSANGGSANASNVLD